MAVAEVAIGGLQILKVVVLIETFYFFLEVGFSIQVKDKSVVMSRRQMNAVG